MKNQNKLGHYSVKPSRYYIADTNNQNSPPCCCGNKVSLVHNDIVITREEFFKLLDVVTPENGLLQSLNRKINLYRPWLKDAYLLAILCGARKQELLNFKWSDIKSEKW